MFPANHSNQQLTFCPASTEMKPTYQITVLVTKSSESVPLYSITQNCFMGDGLTSLQMGGTDWFDSWVVQRRVLTELVIQLWTVGWQWIINLSVVKKMSFPISRYCCSICQMALTKNSVNTAGLRPEIVIRNLLEMKSVWWKHELEAVSSHKLLYCRTTLLLLWTMKGRQFKRNCRGLFWSIIPECIYRRFLSCVRYTAWNGWLPESYESGMSLREPIVKVMRISKKVTPISATNWNFVV